MGGLSFIDENRRHLRQIVLAIDRGQKPARGLNVQLAVDLDLVWCEVKREDRYDFALTDEGLAYARLLRDSDDHGGDAG